MAINSPPRATRNSPPLSTQNSSPQRTRRTQRNVQTVLILRVLRVVRGGEFPYVVESSHTTSANESRRRSNTQYPARNSTTDVAPSASSHRQWPIGPLKNRIS